MFEEATLYEEKVKKQKTKKLKLKALPRNVFLINVLSSTIKTNGGKTAAISTSLADRLQHGHDNPLPTRRPSEVPSLIGSGFSQVTCFD